MDIESLRALLTPAGRTALEAAAALEPRETNFLAQYSTLSRRFPPQLARAALETAILRREAVEKFPQLAERMYFTREALEQAGASIIAEHRSRRFSGRDRAVDLGCSIGGDTLALARVAPTLGIDLDPLRLAMAKANLEAAGLGERVRFVRADLMNPLPLALREGDAAFFDPARRAGGRRAFSVHEYRPSLAHALEWLRAVPAMGVKISPGVALDELEPYPAEVEFISLNGQLKEAVLWLGDFKRVGRRATLLPAGVEITGETRRRSDEAEMPDLREPEAYLYEPDPAVLRAGLVRSLAEQIGATQLDADIAYLTAAYEVETPFARRWAIETWMPFGEKRLRAALRARGVNRVVVKKRGSPLEPEALIRDLRLKRLPGDDVVERVVVLTHLRGRPIMILCYPNN